MSWKPEYKTRETQKIFHGLAHCRAKSFCCVGMKWGSVTICTSNHCGKLYHSSKFMIVNKIICQKFIYSKLCTSLRVGLCIFGLKQCSRNHGDPFQNSLHPRNETENCLYFSNWDQSWSYWVMELKTMVNPQSLELVKLLPLYLKSWVRALVQADMDDVHINAVSCYILPSLFASKVSCQSRFRVMIISWNTVIQP